MVEQTAIQKDGKQLSVLSADFVFERATKNTYRYEEESGTEDQIVGVIYVQKSAFGGVKPERIRVFIQAVEPTG